MNKDLRKEQNTETEPFFSKGRPIYLKAYAYSHVDENGHIHKGEEVLLFMGREKLNIEDVTNEFN